MQKTICQNITAQGIGLHSGREVSVVLKPALPGTGIKFQRSDLAYPPLAATTANISSTPLATALGQKDCPANRVSTVEHLMSALAALGIDNILVLVNAPELPIFDGSALEWFRLLKKAGLAEQNASKETLRVLEPYKFSIGDNPANMRSIEMWPASRFSVEAHIDFAGHIGRHSFNYVGSEESFENEIAPARTFCRLCDVEMMQSQGLALGGSLANAVVVTDDAVLNPEGLRFKNEFVRHKILDFIGDIALAGLAIRGHFVLHKPGHELTGQFLTKVLAEPGLFQLEKTARKMKSLPAHSRHHRPLAEAVAPAWA